MAFVAADWSVAVNGDIRYIGNDHNGAAPSYVTAIDWYREIQDLADDAVASGDDLIDITSDTFGERSTDNIITLINSYNIDAGAAEHIYDGTIAQGVGAERWDGIINFGNVDLELMITQDGAVLADDWWNQGGTNSTATGGSTSTIADTTQAWTVDEWIGYTVRNTTDGCQGIITSNTATVLTISDLVYGGTANTTINTDVYYIVKGLNADLASGISHNFMIKTITGSADIDARKVVGACRTYSKTYNEFTINATNPGNNVLAVSDTGDLNNVTAPNSLYSSVSSLFISPFTTIANTNTGYNHIDVDNDAVANEFFFTDYDIGSATKNQLYEYTKYITRYKGEAGTVYGLAADLFRGITHEIAITGIGGTWVEPESLTWTGGTGQLLAVDNVAGASTTTMWIQVLTGTAPTSGTVTGAGLATGTATAATARTLSFPFSGVSTGTAIIGAYGFGIEAADLGASDLMRALDNNTYQPPNNVTFTVGGLIVGEDRVLVTKELTGGIDIAQLALNTTLIGAAETVVVITTTIPPDTPSPTGTIRVVNDQGFEIPLPYSSWTGSTFTLTSTYNFSGVDENDQATAANNVYISYIDKLATVVSESFTVVYDADLPLFIRVRDGGVSPIKTFETTGTLSSSGGSTTAIRTTDA